ncbi:hypothetical protein D3C83_03960 [compost metagenome]
MPARAPASIDILQIVSRPSMVSARMAGPAYSITCPVAPAVPILAMMARMTSFALTPGASAPSTLTRSVRGFFCHRHCVARICFNCDAPMPKASAPSAPCVEVCESPQASVIPGCVKPNSGPTTCTMP